MNLRIGWALSLAFLAACGGGLSNDMHPTGSTTMVAMDRGDTLVAVNVFEGSLSRIDVDGQRVDELVLGAEPSRIAPFGDYVLVTLRGERTVVVVDVSGPKMKVHERIRTGAEPFGIVADEQAKHFWVAVSQADQVVEFDKNFEKVRSFKVGNEPRWLALHPSRKALFAVSARGGKTTRIDLTDGEETPVEPPVMVRPIDPEDGEVELDHRYTGDPAVTADGKWLVIPGIHADTTTPVQTPENDDIPVADGYGGGNQITIGRINPSLVAVPLDRHGNVDPDEDIRVIFLAVQAERGEIVRSYPTSVTSDPEGGQVLVTMEASQAVLSVELRPFKGQGDADGRNGSRADTGMGMVEPGFDGVTSTGGFDPDGRSFMPSFPPAMGGFTDRAMVAVSTSSAGPDGVIFTDRDRAWVHSFIDRRVAPLPYERAEDDLNESAENGFNITTRLKTDPGTLVTEPSLPDDVQMGLELFYGARDARMAATGAGVSCSTCHNGVRDDGFTWTFDRGVRQTPTLAGTVSETFPVTWTDSVDSVATEAMLTSKLRMGGMGLAQQEADAIQAFVDYGRRVDVGADDLDPKAVARGEALFNRADVGCAECHAGERYTDNEQHELYGLESVNTPTLTGIKASAPYMHDGSAATLADVLALSKAKLMGDTSMLTQAELDDLETYLKSL